MEAVLVLAFIAYGGGVVSAVLFVSVCSKMSSVKVWICCLAIVTGFDDILSYIS